MSFNFQVIYGQQPLNNNQQNILNNAKSLQQLQRTNNVNQIPNGGLNINLAQQSNLQTANLQQSSNLSGSKQGNLQQSLSLPPNLQSQSASVPQNSLQITKIGFTPVSATTVNNPYSAIQLQNGGVNPNVQVLQPQNVQMSNIPAAQVTNTPSSTLADLMALKGQPSLLSLLNPQNGGQPQQNSPIVVNTIPAQNQLTDVQKQFLVRSLQSQNSGQNQQAMNLIQTQQRMGNMDYLQPITGIQGSSQPVQAIVTPLGNQPPYITVQAQPLTNYLQTQTPQVIVEEEPSLLSIILSELGPQYGIDVSYAAPNKGSKPNLKTLIPLIINLIREKNCACRNCGCPNNGCQNNGCQNIAWPSNMMAEPQMAQIFGGYSNQKTYGQGLEDTPSRIKKNDDEESRKNDKERKVDNKQPVIEESEEVSEEDDSEYDDDGDE